MKCPTSSPHFTLSLKCICPNCQMYLSKLLNVFVQIVKCICPHCQIYLYVHHVLMNWLTPHTALPPFPSFPLTMIQNHWQEDFFIIASQVESLHPLTKPFHPGCMLQARVAGARVKHIFNLECVQVFLRTDFENLLGCNQKDLTKWPQMGPPKGPNGLFLKNNPPPKH